MLASCSSAVPARDIAFNGCEHRAGDERWGALHDGQAVFGKKATADLAGARGHGALIRLRLRCSGAPLYAPP